MLLILATVMLAAGAAMVTLQKPWLGVFVFVLFTAFDFPVHAGSVVVYINEALLAAVLAGWVIGSLVQGRLRKTGVAEILWAVPFLAAVGLSAVNAQHAPAVLKQVLRWLELVLGVWFVAHAVEGEKQIRFLVRSLLVVGAGVGVLGIVQTLAGPWSHVNAGRSFLINNFIMRSYATFGHPNQFAGYLNLLLPLAAVQFLRGKPQELSWPAGLAFFILAVALIFTFSRGAWLAACVALSVVLLVSHPVQKLELAALCAAAVVAAFLVLATAVPKPLGIIPRTAAQLAGHPVVSRIKSLAVASDSSTVSRKRFTLVALDMFSRHPWLGFGAGEYPLHIRRYLNERSFDWSAARTHIHNLYLQILIESGLFGLAGFLLLAFVYLTRTLPWLSRIADRPDAWLPLALTVASVAFLLHNGFDVLVVHSRGLHWAVIVGLGLAWTRCVPLAPKPMEAL